MKKNIYIIVGVGIIVIVGSWLILSNGFWQDSVTVYPTITPINFSGTGSYIEIESDGVFNAYPSLIKLSDAHFIVFYTKGESEVGYKNTIVKKESTDAGVTWGSEVTVLSDGTYSLMDAYAALLSNGTIIISFFKETLSFPYLGIAVFTMKSTDSGVNWSTPVNLGSSFTYEVASSAPVVELGNGNLLMPIFGLNTGDTYYSARVMKSTDGGDSWGSEITIVIGESRYYGEPNIILLGNGDLFAMIRTGDSIFYSSVSTDSGATWSAVAAKFSAAGMPYIFLLNNGNIICVYRTMASGKGGTTALRVSTDSGATWTSDANEIFLESDLRSMRYASAIQLSSGKIYITYGLQAIVEEDSDIRLRIYQNTVDGSVRTTTQGTLAEIRTVAGDYGFPSLKETDLVQETIEKEVVLVIDDGGGNPNTFVAEFKEGMTAFDLLKNKTEESGIALKTKTYDIGTMVEAIGDQENGQDGKYWLYYVNGEMPMVAADKKEIRAGDKIEFKFEKSPF